MKATNYTVPFIVSLIQNKHKIGESRYFKADLSASDMLMDLDEIVAKAKLTDKQMYIMENYWIAGYTQAEVAFKLGITQQMIEKHSKAIKKKVKKILLEQGELTNDN
jgi:DNA-directed RNA polymerase specialized sigma subunit